MRARTLITLINIASLPLALLFSFLVFISGVFTSDSGTSAAIAVSLGVIAFSAAHLIFTLVALWQSQKRRSLGWAVAPLVLPLLLLAWVFGPIPFGVDLN